MNGGRLDESSSRPTYMTQAEASAVMELHVRCQHEDTARLELVTIDDVAEATQLAPEEIHRLLKQVRIAAANPRSAARRSDLGEVDWIPTLIKFAPSSVLWIWLVSILFVVCHIPVPLFYLAALWTADVILFFVGRLVWARVTRAVVRKASIAPRTLLDR